MKKLIISLLTGILLTMSGFSQHYEYTANSFVQYFDDNTLDKTNVFTWTSASSGPTFTINETDEIMTITNVFKNWQEAKLNFDSTNLDISDEPYVCFEAKVSEELDTNTLAVQLVDGDGKYTSNQNVIQLTTEWKVYKVYFHPGGMYGGTDPTIIKSMSFHRLNYGEQLSANLMLRTGISVGDTSYNSSITNVEENIATEQDITIYPNPVKDVLTISGIMVKEAIISDLTGKVIMIIESGDVSAGIDVSGLASGMYIISCSTENGTIQDTFIKE